MTADAEKKVAAARGLGLVENGMTLGLGTGSTAAHFVRLLGTKVAEGLSVRGVPTSEATADLARESGVPLVSLEEAEAIDLCIDGVDEVDPALNAIKGGGGALLREKIVASAARRIVYICDASKLVPVLGAFPLPVEVVPFAEPLVRRRIQERFGIEARRRVAGGGAFVSDEGNWILDCHFDRIEDPAALGAELVAMPGVVEHGLFTGMIDTVIVGRGTTAEVINRP